MQRMLRSSLAAAAAALALTTLACNKDRADENASLTPDTGGAVATAPAPNAAPAAALNVTDVTLGKGMVGDTAVADATDDFAPGDTIHAVVRHEGPAGATLTARWTYQDGQVVDERTETLAAAGAHTTHFLITKPSGWPAGDYKLHVLVNGNEVQSEDFKVEKP
ncbi:MAG TPA: hypothetical protein VF048_08915 [Gemmatimonadaceae bacterium]